MHYHWVGRVSYFFQNLKNSIDLNGTFSSLFENFQNLYPDGGNMAYFIYLVKKFGLVPKEGFNGNRHSEVDYQNFLLDLKEALISYCIVIRNLRKTIKAGNIINDQIELFKKSTFHKLETFYGKPVVKPDEKFCYKYKKSDGTSNCIVYTPRTFVEGLCPSLRGKYIIIRKCCEADMEKLWENNMVEYDLFATQMCYACVKIDTLITLVFKFLEKKHDVYGAYNLGNNLDFSKDSLEITIPSQEKIKPDIHAMLIVGAATIKFITNSILSSRIKNCYGKNSGIKSHHTMSIENFKKSILEIAVPFYIFELYCNNENPC